MMPKYSSSIYCTVVIFASRKELYTAYQTSQLPSLPTAPNLARVVANLHAPALRVVLGTGCQLVKVLGVLLALVEDMIDVVGDQTAIDAVVLRVVLAAEEDGAVVGAADSRALACLRVANGSLLAQVFLSLDKVFSLRSPVHMVCVLAYDLAVIASTQDAIVAARSQGLIIVSLE